MTVVDRQCVALTLVERDDVALGDVLVLDTEDPLAFGVEQAQLNEFVDATPGAEGGVQ